MRLLLIWLTLTLTHPLQAANQKFDRLIKFGLQNSSELKNARRKIENAEALVTAADSSLYPKIKLSSRHGFAGSDPSEKENNFLSQFSIGLSYPILQNFESSNQRDNADLAYELAQIEWSEALSQFVSDVHIAIFNLSIKTEELRNAETKHALIKNQFEELERSFKAGFKPRTDYLRFKSQFQRSTINLESLKNSLEIQKLKISVLLGANRSDGIEIAGIDPDYSKIPEVESGDFSTNDHFVTKKAHLQNLISTVSADLAARATGFEWTAGIDAQYGASDYWRYPERTIEDQTGSNWAAYIGIGYNLFDGGSTASALKIATNKKLSTIEDSLLAKRELEQQKVKLTRDIHLNQKTAKLNMELLKLEKNNFELLKRKYQQGQVNILELTTALENLESSKNSYITSYFQLLIAKTELWHHSGKFNEKIILLSLSVTIFLIWYLNFGPNRKESENTSDEGQHTIERGDIVKVASLSGTIRANKTYSLKAIYPGYVRKIFAKIGERVKKNQPLATISESLQTPIDQIFPVRAPFTGTVTQIFKRSGEYIDQNEQLNKAVLQLDDLSTLFVFAEVPELEISSMKAGLTAEITANAIPFETLRGEIVEVAMSATAARNNWDAKSSTYKVKIQLEPSEIPIKTGMSAIAKIETQRKDDVVKIPHEFVGKDSDGYFVRAKNGEKKVITIGIFNSSNYEVTEGLNEGEIVSSIDFSQDFSTE
ncbi:TolC family protein [Oligoflexaceae bacterium]|nr:TolC family protein [Oligoflexaceae bacterium]